MNKELKILMEEIIMFLKKIHEDLYSLDAKLSDKPKQGSTRSPYDPSSFPRPKR